MRLGSHAARPLTCPTPVQRPPSPPPGGVLSAPGSLRRCRVGVHRRTRPRGRQLRAGRLVQLRLARHARCSGRSTLARDPVVEARIRRGDRVLHFPRSSARWAAVRHVPASPCGTHGARKRGGLPDRLAPCLLAFALRRAAGGARAGGPSVRLRLLSRPAPSSDRPLQVADVRALRPLLHRVLVASHPAGLPRLQARTVLHLALHLVEYALPW